MADSLSVQRIPLRFLYMCMHDVTGYFRRIDGSPLNISTMTGPHDPEVVREPIDPQAATQVHIRVRPLMRVCERCRDRRRNHIETVHQRFQNTTGTEPCEWLEVLEEMQQTYAEWDLRLVERALGHDIRRVRERVERRLNEGSLDDENGENPQQPQSQ